MAILLFLAVLVSGTAALVAEVIWFRALGRGVGTSAEALAVVSASFLGGLGIGAAIASRLAPRSLFPFRAAALCEAAAGVLVFLSPFALAVVPDAHLFVLHALGMEPGPSAWPAALVGGLVLVFPTAFLGATLPFLVKSRLKDVGFAGRWTGRLYAVNTVGAATGVVVAVFLLLPALGETMTLRIAAAGNVLAALLILLAERPLGTTAEPAAATPAEVPLSSPSPAPEAHSTPTPALAPIPPAPLPPAVSPTLVGAALFVSGALALGGEVAWFRLLEPVAGIHLYGFALLLGSVLVGTAIGGAIGGVVADSSKRPDLALATTVGIGGLLAAASVAMAGLVPFFSLWTTPRDWLGTTSAIDELVKANKGGAADAIHVAFTTKMKVLGSALCVVPPLAAFAAAYPLAVKALSKTPARAAGASGSVYAWNTAGNVVGSALAGFVLLPRLGPAVTLVLLGGLGLALSVAMRLLSPHPKRLGWVAVPLVPLLLLTVPGPRDALLSSGPRISEVVLVTQVSRDFEVRRPSDVRALADVYVGVPPRPFGRKDLPPVAPHEGVMSSVILLEERGTVRLRQGGQSESKFSNDDPDAGSETEVALALLPYLIHPDPKRALVIGHGAGWTAEAMLAGELERVDVAELEPAVLDAVEEFRGPLAVRKDPKARLWIADGRLLVREAASLGGTYDLIVSQPSHPWVPGAGHLFTADAYRLARKALAKGGVFAQWLNLFSMKPGLFRSAVASFVSAFPEAWLVLYHDEVVLVGFTAPPHADADRFRRAFAGGPLAARATAAGIRDAADLWKRFAADGAGLAKIAADAEPATDEDARIELGCARVKFGGDSVSKKEKEELNGLIQRAFPPDLPAAWPDAGARDRWAAEVVLRLAEDGDLDGAERWAQKVPFSAGALGKRARARLLLAQAAKSGSGTAEGQRLTKRAEDLLAAAVKEDPRDREALHALVDLRLDDGRPDEAAAAAEEGARRFEDDGRLLATWARALVTHGRSEKAIEVFRRAMKARSPTAPAGTGAQFARLIRYAAPTEKAEALEVYRSDPAVADDADALAAWKELEIELGKEDTPPPHPEDLVQEKMDALDRREGEKALAAARRGTQNSASDGLEHARKAVRLLPDSAEAWRLKGYYEARSDDLDEAVASLRKAISLASDPDAERRTAEAYLRVTGHDPAALSKPRNDEGEGTEAGE